MRERVNTVPFSNIGRPPVAPTRARAGSLDARLDIWYVDLDVSADAVRSFRELLSEDELSKADSFRTDVHRHRYIAGRAALRRVLADHLGCSPDVIRFAYGSYGRPRLEGHGLSVQFNLAHSGADAVIAVTEGPAIGVDIEQIRPVADPRSLARHAFSPTERRELDLAPDPALAFLNGWTRKEAYLKAIGVGCHAPLTQITVSLSGRAALISTGFPEQSPLDWSLLNVSHPRGLVALALGPLGQLQPGLT